MKILIVDDESSARYGLEKALQNQATLDSAANLTAARQLLQARAPDLILLDLNLGQENGFELLEEIARSQDPPLVIVITAHGNERVAVEAMKKGAYDYLSKPFDLDELRLSASRAGHQISLDRQNRRLRQELSETTGFGELIGSSPTMQAVYGLVEKVAETDVTVLLTGESGCGKELVAREIHRRSPRSGPLVCINCAAIPESLIESELFGHEKGAFTGATQRRIGKFEKAGGGTLFLDEVGDMPRETQGKLLPVLEEKTIERLGSSTPLPVDVRIISATNRKLRQMVEKGEFREDLYYRLEVVEIAIPPLRSRQEDILLLVHYFLKSLSRKHGRSEPAIDSRALELLAAYPFPGNVRQLRNAIERLVVLDRSGRIMPRDLPTEIRYFVAGEGTTATQTRLHRFFKMDFRTAREAFERRYLLWNLREHQNNITQTAQAIGIHRQSLQQKIKERGLRALMKP